MNNSEILTKVDEVLQRLSQNTSANSVLSEAKTIVSVTVGMNNPFYSELCAINVHKNNQAFHIHNIKGILESFRFFVESDLVGKDSLRRQAQLEVVNDLMEQAQIFIDDTKVHAAIPITIIGAALEEFLRTWSEEVTESELGNGSLSVYSNLLRKADLITKQDVKDITSWAGLRNSAAHGKWEEVDDDKQASLMLMGVNLFMRKYSESSRN